MFSTFSREIPAVRISITATATASIAAKGISCGGFLLKTVGAPPDGTVQGSAMLSAFTRSARARSERSAPAPAAMEPAADPLHRVPVRFYSEAARLHDADLNAGYDAGARGQECPATASRSWWHGWRNGMMDSHRLPRDEAALCLRQQASKAYVFANMHGWINDPDRDENWRRKC